MKSTLIRHARVQIIAAMTASILARGLATPLPETLRINCGASTETTDTTGRIWMSDTGFFDGLASPDTHAPVSAGEIPTVCRSERYGMTGFWVPLANGSYRVILTFCESYGVITNAGQRLFDMEVECVPIRGVDPFKDGSGIFKPSRKEVIVNIRDGKLDMKFMAIQQSPQINAIEVEALPFGGEKSAPPGYDQPRNVAKGTLQAVSYFSKTLGFDRPANVYTPPGYDPSIPYPVLYLLHGGGGNFTSWESPNKASTILDNLIAEAKIVPMIVVMPQGSLESTQTNTVLQAQATRVQQSPQERLEKFEGDLMNDLIPFIEATYSVRAEAGGRALAGLSMGGGQTYWIISRHLEQFAYAGAFSAGLLGQTREIVAKRFPEGDTVNAALKLFWVSCGDADRYYPRVIDVLQLLDELGVNYVWLKQKGSHAAPVWSEDLYLFSQRLFR